MRDDRRIKERYELSLDNRQIATFFIAVIVVVGTVFVLGVVVGKKLAVGRGSSSAADLLSALDEKAAAMEQAKALAPPPAEPRLTFQDELTKKPAAAPAKEGPFAREETEAKSAAAPGEAGPIPEPPKPEPSREKHKQAIARVENTPIERGPAAGSFTLQLSASQVREDADRFAAKLRERGYQPYIVEADVKDRGRWYRVRMGKFPTKEAALKYLDDFRRETQLQAFVTPAQ